MRELGHTPVRLSAGHNGIWYAGELWRASKWRAEFGAQLNGRVHFRVVILDEPGLLDLSDLQDPRIAVCMPAGRPVAAETHERELRVLRDAKAAYAVQDEPARRSVEAREAWLAAHVAAGRAAQLERGSVISAPPLEVEPGSLFNGRDDRAWAARIGSQLLRRSYPEPLFEVRRLIRPLSPVTDAPRLFARATQGREAAADPALDALAAALGITGPPELCAADAPFLRLVSDALDAVPAGQISQHLVRVLGLPHELAALVLHLLPAIGTSVVLREDHGVRSLDGAALPGRRIGRRALPTMAWAPNIVSDVELLERGSASPDIDPETLDLLGIEATESSHDVEARVRRWQEDVRLRLPEARDFLKSIAAAQASRAPQEVQDAIATLERLTDGERGSRALQEGGVAARSAIDLWNGWREEATHGQRVVMTLQHPWRLDLGRAGDGLAIEHVALNGRLNDPRVSLMPRQWRALADADVSLRGRFAAAYVRHHEAHDLHVEQLSARMEDVSRRVAALAWLNTIEELGPPQGTDLPGLVADLRPLVKPCGSNVDIVSVARHGSCLRCGLASGDEPLTEEVEQIETYVDQALGNRCRDLASVLAKRIVRSAARGRLERLMQLVQISDLTGLANVLDEESTVFLRGLLREPAPVAAHA